MGVKDYESKTKAKAAAHDLQALGKELALLPLSTLKEMELPERLFDAFEELTRTRGHEGTRRQMQYIGKIMRLVDPEPIAARLALINKSSQESKVLFKKCEGFRDDMLNPTLSAAALEVFCKSYPQAKRELLQNTITTALFEKSQGKSPKHARILFREIEGTVTQHMFAPPT